MKTKYFLFACLMSFVKFVFAQPDLLWYQLYDYVGLQDYAYEMAIDSNKNIFIVGMTEISNYPQTNFDGIILKYNQSGNLLWTRRHSISTEGFYDIFVDLLVCDSGKVLVSGNMQSWPSNRLVSIMYGPDGDTVWNHIYMQQGYLEGEFNTTRRMIIDKSTNYWIIDYVGIDPYSKLLIVKYDRNGQNQEVNYSDYLNGTYPTDINVIERDSIYIFETYSKKISTSTYVPAIIKFNDRGDKIWETILLDSSTTFRSSKILVDDSLNVYSIVQSYEYYDNSCYLVKLDPEGNILWQNLFFLTPEERVQPTHLIQKSDGTIYIIGQYMETDSTESGSGYFLFKYDNNGNLLLSKKELQTRYIDQIPDVKVSDDQNLYILLQSELPNSYIGDFHLLKYNIEDSLEYELIYDYQNWGSRDESGVDIELFKEDDFVITGYGGPGILAYSIVTTRFSTEPLTVNEPITISEYQLFQNFPNPFNPITTISYSIPKSSLVKLELYDVLGNKIKSLVDEYQNAGSYSFNFSGSELSSGIYFYRLSAGQFIQTKKMILLK